MTYFSGHVHFNFRILRWCPERSSSPVKSASVVEFNFSRNVMQTGNMAPIVTFRLYKFKSFLVRMIKNQFYSSS